MVFLIRQKVALFSINIVSHSAKLLSRLALDRLLPPRCVVCVEETAGDGALCSSCWSTMPFIEPPFCQRLGVPFSHAIGEGAISPAAIADPPVFDRSRSVCLYEGAARDMVHSLKFSRRRELAGPMGRWMARAGRELLRDGPLILPVPLHRSRLFKRQFNQAADLGKVIAQQAQVDFHPLVLVRAKKTRPQVGLTAKQRRKNISGAFELTEEGQRLVAGRQIVLVDDVYTTGSTVEACSRVLLRHRAASVDILTFAVASDWQEG